MSEKEFWDNLEDFQQKAHEICVAIRVEANPPEMCESWNILVDEQGNNCRLGQASEVIPLSDFAAYEPEVREKHGDITVLGYTYAADPYFLGFKRIGSDYADLARYMINVEYSRDEQLRELREPQDGISPSKDDLQYAAQLSVLTDQEYAAYIRDDVETAFAEAMTTMTQEEAEAAFGEFLTDDRPEQERLAEGVRSLKADFRRPLL